MEINWIQIDLNGNGFFTQEEAIRHLAASGRLSAVALAVNASWFDAMDKNGNQKIEPEEFDASLGGN
uniref:EF-hand domain-containing protein n=1 Tax=Globodera pallida TaxID=36090 RepID=A0A183BR91_GLOPA